MTALILGPAADAAAVLCQKKSGALVVRPDACKRRESVADPVALGIVGPAGATGPTGPAGPEGPAGPAGSSGARAWATVDNDGGLGSTPLLLAAQGITAVVHQEAGVYCLTPAAGIDASTGTSIASVEWYHSAGVDYLAQVAWPPGDCAADTFEVRTYTSGGAPSDSVSFTFVAF